MLNHFYLKSKAKKADTRGQMTDNIISRHLFSSIAKLVIINRKFPY